jgi:hypothetical protein
MKIKNLINENEFKPVEITIVLESQGEVDLLRDMGNMNSGSLLDFLDTHQNNLPNRYCKIDIEEVFHALSDALEDLHNPEF